MGRSTAETVKERALTGADLAAHLAQDQKFRRQLVAAIAHGAAARRRVRSRIGLAATAQRLATDEELRREVQQLADEIRNAWSRIEKQRAASHWARNTMLVLAGVGAAAAFVGPRLKSLLSGS